MRVERSVFGYETTLFDESGAERLIIVMHLELGFRVVLHGRADERRGDEPVRDGIVVNRDQGYTSIVVTAPREVMAPR